MDELKINYESQNRMSHSLVTFKKQTLSIWITLFLIINLSIKHLTKSQTIIKAYNRSLIPFYIPGEYHWTDNKTTLFSCSDDPTSDFLTNPTDGADLYYCQPKLYWYRFHNRNDPGIFIAGEFGEPVVRRAEVNVFNEILIWGHEKWWTGELEYVSRARDSAWNEIMEKRKLVPERSTRFRDNQTEPSETIVFYFLIAFPFFAIGSAFLLLFPMLYLGYYLVMTAWWIHYLMDFLIFHPLRKLVRIIFVMGATAYYKRMWAMAEDWFIWTKTHWSMWHILRNTRDERNPYWLEYRKPPNVINYAATFLNPDDYSRHDMEMAEVEFVQEMLRWKDDAPAAVALNLKLELGPKYEAYFSDDYNNILLWEEEEERRRKRELEGTSSSDEDSDDELVKARRLKAKQREKMRERALRFAQKKNDAESEFFRVEKEKRRQQGSPPPPSPYKEDPLSPWSSEEKRKLITRARAELSKYKNIPLPKKAKSDLTPSSKFQREEKLRKALLPLINSVVWPHHIDYMTTGEKVSEMPEDEDEDPHAFDEYFDDEEGESAKKKKEKGNTTSVLAKPKLPQDKGKVKAKGQGGPRTSHKPQAVVVTSPEVKDHQEHKDSTVDEGTAPADDPNKRKSSGGKSESGKSQRDSKSSSKKGSL